MVPLKVQNFLLQREHQGSQQSHTILLQNEERERDHKHIPKHFKEVVLSELTDALYIPGVMRCE